jgi:hypothetical protein
MIWTQTVALGLSSLMAILFPNLAYTGAPQTIKPADQTPLVDIHGSPFPMTPFYSPTPTYTPTPTLTSTPIPTPTVTPTPTLTPLPIVSTSQLDVWFTLYSNQYSVDKSLLTRIAVCESGLRPEATNGIYGGLFQFSETSWRHTRQTMNVDPNPALRFLPEEAIKTAAFKIAVNGATAWPNCAH